MIGSRRRRGEATLDVALVDYIGGLAEGRLVRGDNPVLMTMELVLEVTGLEARRGLLPWGEGERLRRILWQRLRSNPSREISCSICRSHIDLRKLHRWKRAKTST